MCGKFTAKASWSETGAFSSFDAADTGYRGAEDFEVTFRVMGLVPLLVWDAEREERRVIAARWGFPHPDDWRRPQPIHARAETIDTTRAFADAFRAGQRGIVLVKTFNEAPDSGEQHVFEPDAMKTGIAFVWRRSVRSWSVMPRRRPRSPPRSPRPWKLRSMRCTSCQLLSRWGVS